MSTCPFCFSELKTENKGKGIFYKCPSCNAVEYNFSMLKRLGFKRNLFTDFLLKAKHNQSNFAGLCLSCRHPFRKVKFELNDYKTAIYVCPTCLLFVIKSIDIPLFKANNKQKPARNYAKATEEILKELDEKIMADKKKWKLFEKSTKISKSRSIGFIFFLIGLISTYSKAIANNFFPSSIGPFFAIISFIIVLLAGFFLILGWKNVITTLKEYFHR